MQHKDNGTRRLYLIRHGHTNGDKRCISATDLPLDDFGEHQANNLGRWAADKSLTAVYSSPLNRAVATAGQLGLPVTTRENLREVNVGEWEGLSFEEIKIKYPGDFIKRGGHPGTSAPTGGESIHDAGQRLLACLRGIIDESHGDIAVVAHGGANRGALSQLLGRDSDEVLLLPQPWGGISIIEILPDGQLCVKSLGQMPEKYPDTRSTEWLRERYGMPENVRAHCDAVAATAVRLACGVALPVDLELLRSAAELHDISRAHGFDHASEGARLLCESGYSEVSEIIAYHHDLPDDSRIEAQILYLADKLVQENREVPFRERFEGSRKKCTTEEALAAWQRRYDAAVSVAKKLGVEV